MSKLKMVYQDCPTCGNRKEWGEKTIAKAKESGLDIEFISFATPEGQHLCKLAIYAGISKLPFLTNGEKFSQDIANFVKREPKKKARRVKKAKKVEVEDVSAE